MPMVRRPRLPRHTLPVKALHEELLPFSNGCHAANAITRTEQTRWPRGGAGPGANRAMAQGVGRKIKYTPVFLAHQSIGPAKQTAPASPSRSLSSLRHPRGGSSPRACGLGNLAAATLAVGGGTGHRPARRPASKRAEATGGLPGSWLRVCDLAGLPLLACLPATARLRRCTRPPAPGARRAVALAPCDRRPCAPSPS
jgi:hypothetical protein